MNCSEVLCYEDYRDNTCKRHSKRILRKNIRVLAEKPMIAYTIEAVLSKLKQKGGKIGEMLK